MKFCRNIAIIALISGFGLLPASHAQTASSIQLSRADFAAMVQDMNYLKSRVAQLGLEVEQLQRENAQLRQSLNAQGDMSSRLSGYATVNQLNQALSGLETELNRASDQQRREILNEVNRQIERLASRTEAALKAMADSVSAQPARGGNTPQVTFSDNFPKTGVSYTVQSGDTLSGIAGRMNSTVKYIQDANKIANPRELRVGQVIFVPQDPQ